MKKINWKQHSPNYIEARVGNVVLRCFSYRNLISLKLRWKAYASIRETSSTLRYGPLRNSLSKAKEDAVRLARELLMDYKASLTVEMKRFDI